jgi:hypothetical protein
MINDTNFVFVDPHILSSPTMVDVNGDGDIDMLEFISAVQRWARQTNFKKWFVSSSYLVILTNGDQVFQSDNAIA